MSETPTSEERLLPCPFCGKIPELHVPNEIHKDWYWIYCKSSRGQCGITPMTHHAMSLEEVVLSWNTRPYLSKIQKLEEENESLKKAYLRCNKHNLNLKDQLDAAKKQLESQRNAFGFISNELKNRGSKESRIIQVADMSYRGIDVTNPLRESTTVNPNLKMVPNE